MAAILEKKEQKKEKGIEGLLTIFFLILLVIINTYDYDILIIIILDVKYKILNSFQDRGKTLGKFFTSETFLLNEVGEVVLKSYCFISSLHP